MQKPQTANDDGLLLQLVQLYKLRITIFHNIENLWMVAIPPGRMHTRRICNPNSIGIGIFWHLESSISKFPSPQPRALREPAITQFQLGI